MNRTGRVTPSAFLLSYLKIIFWLFALLVLADVGVYYVNTNAGILVSGALLVYLIVALVFYYRKKAAYQDELVTFAAGFGQVQRKLLMELEIPYALMDQEGKLLWFNQEFGDLCGKDSKKYHRSVQTLFEELDPKEFPGNGADTDIHVSYADRDFRAHIQSVNVQELIDTSNLLESEDEKDAILYTVYLFEETELRNYIQMYEDETVAVGLICLDNYDEALAGLEDVRRSLVIALIDRRINRYFSEIDALVRKLEKDKYFLILRNKSLNELKGRKFDILEEIKEVNAGTDMKVTMSIAIGANAGTYTRNNENAKAAMDLALGRGGDQAVLRDGEKTIFFGGRTESEENSTRVKSRVKAQALKEFILSKEKILVMGHKRADADSFGAAVGICCFARELGKSAHIVLDLPASAVQPLVENFEEKLPHEKSLLVDPQTAEKMVDANTLIIVVDTNVPALLECPALLDPSKTVVVLDHHRQSGEVIPHTVLSYIEPKASSACEMVTELLQYVTDDIKLRGPEADAMYAGMVIDTDNFRQRTGVRTFEAAAFLRKQGADMTRVRKVFRDQMEAYRARGEVMRRIMLFRDVFAISICPSEGLESPTTVCAQTANELLNIKNVKASFVLTELNGLIFISARAIDEVNVQIIMERMGGGGHLNIAGCQLKHVTMEEAIDMLKNILAEMLDEGDI